MHHGWVVYNYILEKVFGDEYEIEKYNLENGTSQLKRHIEVGKKECKNEIVTISQSFRM